jgi:hypothetical protein
LGIQSGKVVFGGCGIVSYGYKFLLITFPQKEGSDSEFSGVFLQASQKRARGGGRSGAKKKG